MSGRLHPESVQLCCFLAGRPFWALGPRLSIPTSVKRGSRLAHCEVQGASTQLLVGVPCGVPWGQSGARAHTAEKPDRVCSRNEQGRAKHLRVSGQAVNFPLTRSVHLTSVCWRPRSARPAGTKGDEAYAPRGNDDTATACMAGRGVCRRRRPKFCREGDRARPGCRRARRGLATEAGEPGGPCTAR